MILQDLYQRKQQLIANMTELGNKVAGGQYSAEQNEEFRKIDTDLKGIDSQIEIMKRAEEVRAQANANSSQPVSQAAKEEKKFVDADAGKRSRVFEKNLKGLTLTEEERGIQNSIERYNDVFERWVRSGFRVEKLDEMDRSILMRAQSTTTTAGGYTIPEGFSYEVDKQMQTISQLLNWARIYRTTTGNPIPWPTNNDTSNTGELLSENGDASSSSADLVFGVVTLLAYKFSSKMIKASSEILQDSGINLAQFIGQALGERVGKISNTYFTTGTGSSQPLGYTDATAGFTEGKSAASASAFTPGELVDLMHSVDAAYRASSSCAWAMHDLILAEVKKLSFGSSVYFPLWVPSLAANAPDTILGKPYFVNNAMDSAMTTEKKIMYFGDWSRLVIRIVNDFSLKTLNERYAELDQTAFVGFARMDSKILNRNAVKFLALS